MRTFFSVWVREAGRWRRFKVPHGNLVRATRAAQALLVLRQEIEAVQVRQGGQVRYETQRSEWQGWI